VQAHTLGEVGTLYSFLLRVYSWTFLTIFIEIISCLTDPEQKISWHLFLRLGVMNTISKRHGSQQVGLEIELINREMFLETCEFTFEKLRQ